MVKIRVVAVFVFSLFSAITTRAGLPEFQGAMQAGIQALKDNKLSEAERFFKSAQDEVPSMPPMFRPVMTGTSSLLLSRTYVGMQRYRDAEANGLKALEAAEIDHGPNNVALISALGMMGEIYKQLGNYKQAEAFYERQLRLIEDISSVSDELPKTLNSLAAVYVSEGNYAKAESLLLRSLKLTDATSSPNLYVAQIKLADVYLRTNDFQKSEQILTSALANIKRTVGSNPIYLAPVLDGLCKVHFAQGKTAEALADGQTALGLYENGVELDQTVVAGLLNTLSQIYAAQGEFDQAAKASNRAIGIYEKALGPNHPHLAVTLEGLAAVKVKMASLSEAEPLLIRALAIKEKSLDKTHDAVALSYNNLGVLYTDQAKYPEAEKVFKTGLNIAESALGQEHTVVASILNNLAVLYQKQGNLGQAEALAKRALTIREKILGLVHPDTATTLNNIALIYQDQRRWTEAEQLQLQVVTIYEKVGKNAPTLATVYNNLAQIDSALNKTENVENYLKKALSISEKSLGPDHPKTAISLNNLGMFYSKRGNSTAAKPLLERALRIYEDRFGAQHPDEALMLGNLSLLLVKDHPQEALALSRRSVNILRRTKELSQTSSIMSGLTSPQGNSDALAYHLMLLGKAIDIDPENIETLRAEAFETAQLLGTNATNEALEQSALRIAAGTPSLANKVRELQDAKVRWRLYDKKMLELLAQQETRSSHAVSSIQARLGDVENQITRVNQELLAEFPAYRELRNPEPLSLRDTQKLLKPDEALVRWNISSFQSSVFVVRSDSVKWLAINGDKPRIDSLVRDLRVATTFPDAGDPLPFPYAKAQELYQLLLSGSEEYLDGVSHLIVIPDGSLQSLSFGLLVNAPPNKLKYDKNDFLIRKFALSTLPSISALRALRRNGTTIGAKEPFIGFGDPKLSGGSSPSRGIRHGLASTRGVKVANLYSRGAIADTRAVADMQALPETADELKSIAKSLRAEATDIYLQEKATETQVKNLSLDKYRTVAFATHGLMAGDFIGVQEPALVLTPPNKEGTELDDGLLTATEVANLKLNADWVILSACNTAASDGTPGSNGFSGLTKAFFYAGARTLLVSHWAVDSKSAMAITTRMFQEAEHGKGKAKSLQQAMISLLEKPSSSHPAFWAPFVVVGEGAQ